LHGRYSFPLRSPRNGFGHHPVLHPRQAPVAPSPPAAARPAMPETSQHGPQVSRRLDCSIVLQGDRVLRSLPVGKRSWRRVLRRNFPGNGLGTPDSPALETTACAAVDSRPPVTDFDLNPGV
jgi:hypothetical protein